MTPTDKIISLLSAKAEQMRPILDSGLGLHQVHFRVTFDERAYPVGVAFELQEDLPRREKKRLG